MIIKEKIKADRLESRRNRNEKDTAILTYILGQIDLKEKDNAKGDVALAVIKSHIKSMSDVITLKEEQCKDYSNEVYEIEFLNKYLPEQVSNEELENFIIEISATENNRGLIMKAIKEKFGDAVDMKVANQILSTKI